MTTRVEIRSKQETTRLSQWQLQPADYSGCGHEQRAHKRCSWSIHIQLNTSSAVHDATLGLTQLATFFRSTPLPSAPRYIIL